VHFFSVCVIDKTCSYFSSPEIWFDDVDISEINGEVATPSQKKLREDVKPTTVELVSGKCTE